MRCVPVAPPVDNFAEIASPVPNYASPANKLKSPLPQLYRNSIPGDFLGNFGFPLSASISITILSLWASSATWLLRFRIVSSDGYVVSDFTSNPCKLTWIPWKLFCSLMPTASLGYIKCKYPWISVTKFMAGYRRIP